MLSIFNPLFSPLWLYPLLQLLYLLYCFTSTFFSHFFVITLYFSIGLVSVPVVSLFLLVLYLYSLPHFLHRQKFSPILISPFGVPNVFLFLGFKLNFLQLFFQLLLLIFLIKTESSPPLPFHLLWLNLVSGFSFLCSTLSSATALSKHPAFSVFLFLLHLTLIPWLALIFILPIFLSLNLLYFPLTFSVLLVSLPYFVSLTLPFFSLLSLL